MIRHLRASVPSLLLLAACASRTPGAHPHDMSAASHETMAVREQQAAGEHEARFDPSAGRRRERCQPGRPAANPTDACWTSVTNPTSEHLRRAEELACSG